MAPAHMTHGSSVTYNLHSSKRQLPTTFEARSIAICSACAVGSCAVSLKLCDRAMTSLFLTMIAPIGTSPSF